MGVAMVSMRSVLHRLTGLNTYFTVGGCLNQLKAHSVIRNSFMPSTMNLAITYGWKRPRGDPRGKANTVICLYRYRF